MGRRDQYRAELRTLDAADWPAHLTRHSGLPGPRGNIELAQAVAVEGGPECFERLIASGDEYLVFCGVLGLGRLLAEDDRPDLVARLLGYAADSRWRVREAVAMALQTLGDADLPRLATLAVRWSGDPGPLVARAAAAGICEPRLLTSAEGVACALDVCERATTALAARPADQRREPGVRSLRQALGYCWSVAVAADPAAGLPRFDALTTDPVLGTDPDVAWIVRENRKKARLATLL